HPSLLPESATPYMAPLPPCAVAQAPFLPRLTRKALPSRLPTITTRPEAAATAPSQSPDRSSRTRTRLNPSAEPCATYGRPSWPSPTTQTSFRPATATDRRWPGPVSSPRTGTSVQEIGRAHV